VIKFVKFFPEVIAVNLPSSSFIGMISITEPDEKVKFTYDWEFLLRLYFHDLVKPYPTYVLFSSEQAHQILDWLEVHENTLRGVYVHCVAGISRSAAVGMFIADMYEISGFNYFEAGAYNKLVYQTLSDALFERRGRRLTARDFPRIGSNEIW
jgi:hypothetical protein